MPKVLLSLILVFGEAVVANEDLGSQIYHNESGYYMNIFDYRPETMEFMDRNQLQGGGVTWMALVQAALEIESPTTLAAIEFDDEADMVLVTAQSKPVMEIVQTYFLLIASDDVFRRKCIDRAKVGGYLE